MPSLAERAAADTAAAPAAPGDTGETGDSGATFQKADLSSAIPPEQQDAVQRIVAAGMKMMYGPNMRDQLRKAINSPDPTPKVLAENVAGLMLMMDKASKGGLPAQAILPAAVELLGDAADAMVQAGRPVSQEDYKSAIQMLFVLISHKMGMNEAQIMDTANKALPPDQQLNGGAPPDGPAAVASEQQGVDPTIAAAGKQAAAAAAGGAPGAPGAAPPGTPPIPPDEQQPQ